MDHYYFLHRVRHLKKEEIDTSIIDYCGHACLDISQYG